MFFVGSASKVFVSHLFTLKVVNGCTYVVDVSVVRNDFVVFLMYIIVRLC